MRYKQSKTSLPSATLKQAVTYDQKTGVFTWIGARRGISVGTVAGCIANYGANGKKRVKICINGQDYMAHRLAWLYMTGGWPPQEVDHVNGDGTDNRWENLRLATSSQNLSNRPPPSNNTTGYKGVCLFKRTGRYLAYINADGKRKYLGYHDTAEAAYAAYCAEAKILHGKFAKL